jgi:hypothetical protein
VEDEQAHNDERPKDDGRNVDVEAPLRLQGAQWTDWHERRACDRSGGRYHSGEPAHEQTSQNCNGAKLPP